MKLTRFVLPTLIFGIVLLGTPTKAQTLPDPIIRMSDAVADAPGSRSTTNASFDVYESGSRTYTGSVRGTFTSSAGDEPDAEGSFSFTLQELKSDHFKELFGKNKFTVAFDFKVLTSRKLAYFRVTQFPKVSEFDMKKIVKKWFYVDVGEDASEYESKLDISSQEILEHFPEAYRKYPAITFTEQGSTGKEYVYAFRANPTTFMQLVNEAYRLAGEDAVFSTSDLREFGSHFDTVTGTYRINKATYLPTVATYRFGYRYDDSRLTVSAKTTYKYGSVKSIKKPSGAVSFERLIENVYGGSLNSARSKGSDAALKSNLANARAEAELYYDARYNTYEGVCATRGTWIIGDNVSAAANATGKGKGECNDTPWEWAASAKLTNGSYYCVDSTGFAGEARKKLGTATSCP